MCQTVHNHSNASIKQIGSYGQTHHNKCSKCLALAVALRLFRHWLIAWSVMLCWIPDHAEIVSSGTFAECLTVWCVPLTSAKCQFPVSLAIGRVVLCVPRNASFSGDLTGSSCVFLCHIPWTGLPTLSLTTNSSWLPLGGLPCLSSALLMPVPQPCWIGCQL